MKQSFLKIILLFLIFTVACSQKNKSGISQSSNVNQKVDLNDKQNKKLDVPENWKKIEECGFSFYAPTNFKEVKVQPIDSCATNYRNDDILFSIDLCHGGGTEDGTRRNEYSGKDDFQIAETIIDGRKAEIITCYQSSSDFKERKDLSYGAVLYVPVVNESGDNLTIWTYSRSAEDREITKAIFKTIRFGK